MKIRHSRIAGIRCTARPWRLLRVKIAGFRHFGGGTVYTADMTPEIWTIISVGIALGALIVNGQRSLRKDMRAELAEVRSELAEVRSEVAEVRDGLAQLRERMAHLEGLLEGLREAITRNRAA